jgi:hypothetical protein
MAIVKQTPDITMEDMGPEMSRADAKDLVKLFLQKNLFGNKVQIFVFFIKYWMPYERKVAEARSLWQKKFQDSDRLRLKPTLEWRRDFNKSQKTLSDELKRWILDYESESLAEVDERFGKYDLYMLTNLRDHNQMKEGYLYENKLLAQKAGPIEWFIRRELYAPDLPAHMHFDG